MTDYEKELARVGRRLARLRATDAVVKAEAARLAEGAPAAGVSERRTAELLGVNRMTLRVWLGKQSA